MFYSIFSNQDKSILRLGGGGGGWKRAGFKRYISITCWSTKNVLLSQQVLSEIVVLHLYPPVYGLLLALDGVKDPLSLTMMHHDLFIMKCKAVTHYPLLRSTFFALFRGFQFYLERRNFWKN